MATCEKCGAAMEDGQTICPQCGEPVAQPKDQSAAADSEATLESTPLTPAENAVEEHPEEEHAAEAGEHPAEEHPADSHLQPERKPLQKSKKIGIIVACCAVFLLLCGFAAKTYFARDLKMLVMGNSKYMQSMERSTAEALTGQTVGAVDMVMQQLPTKNNNMAEEGKVSLHVDLDNAFKEMVKPQLGGREEVLDKTLDYINSISMEAGSNINNQQMQSNTVVKDKSGKLFSVNMFIDKDGKYLMQMPEISKTYFVMENKGVRNPVMAASNLSYDHDKLNASLRALTQPYVEAVQNGKVTVQKNQSLKVGDVSVNNAAKVSVTFTEEQLNQVMKKTLETMKKDDYLCTYLSENYNLFSTAEKMDKQKFQQMLDEYSKQFDSDTSKGTLTVSAYVLADDTQVARSYEFNDSVSTKGAVNFIFQQKQFAANVIVNDKEYFSAKLLFHTADSGVMQVSVKDPDTSADMGLKIDFSDVKKAKFANKDTLLGKFNISLSDPKGTLQNAFLPSVGQNPWAKDLLKSTLKLECSMQGDTFHSNCTLDIKGIATVKLTGETKQKTSSAITIPSVKEDEALKLDAAGAGAQQYELQKKYSGEVMTYLSAQLGKDKELADLLQEFGINKTIIDYYRAQLQ